jgi:hypothetical protein
MELAITDGKKESDDSLNSKDDIDGNSDSSKEDGEVVDLANIVDDDDDDMYYDCDGTCGKSYMPSAGLNACREGCIDTTFCNDCILLVKNRTLPYRICSADHDWLHVSANTMPTMEKGYVKLLSDEKLGLPEHVMKLEEWYAKLRYDWAL